MSRSNFKYDRDILKQIIKLAVPLIINGFILTIMGLMINYSLHLFSNPYMSFGYVVLLRIQTLMFTPIQGISQGFCIVTAHLTGARRFETIISTLKKTLGIVLVFAVIFSLFYLNSYHNIINHFTSNVDAKNAIAIIMVFSIINYLLQPAVRIFSYTFAGLGKSIYCLMSLLVNIILFVVFMFMGALIFKSGEFSIFIAIVLSDVGQLLIMGMLLQQTFAEKIKIPTSEAQISGN